MMLTQGARRPGRVLIIVAVLWLLVYKIIPRGASSLGIGQQKMDVDVLTYVDPLVGTYGPGCIPSTILPQNKSDECTGHVFGGASLPYAMVKPVADTVDNNRGGFSSDGNLIMGFSHMHDTGVGGVSAIDWYLRRRSLLY